MCTRSRLSRDWLSGLIFCKDDLLSLRIGRTGRWPGIRPPCPRRNDGLGIFLFVDIIQVVRWTGSLRWMRELFVTILGIRVPFLAQNALLPGRCARGWYRGGCFGRRVARGARGRPAGIFLGLDISVIATRSLSFGRGS